MQLSTVETARKVFIDAVIAPAQEASEGVPRLRVLLEHWISYATQPLFPGGCLCGGSPIHRPAGCDIN